MDATAKAVFLSYASQDAEAARRLCEALRAGGLEVWFDRSELRGGDAWDASIRKQIRECALFVPIISATTNARSEGYFRREWKLAVDRMMDLADDQPFLLPVAIDDVQEGTARIPDVFRERQWSRLSGGEPTAEFLSASGACSAGPCRRRGARRKPRAGSATEGQGNAIEPPRVADGHHRAGWSRHRGVVRNRPLPAAGGRCGVFRPGPAHDVRGAARSPPRKATSRPRHSPVR